MADPDKPYNFKPDAVPTIRDEATGHVLFDADTELVGKCSCGAPTDGGYPVCAGILAGGPHIFSGE